MPPTIGRTPSKHTPFLCRCRQLNAIAVYDDTFVDGSDLWWLNSAHRSLEQEMLRSGATSIFPLDDGYGQTTCLNLRASDWYLSGGHGQYSFLNPLEYPHGTWNVSPSTAAIGPTVLNHDITSMNVIASGTTHIHCVGPEDGGVGDTTLVPTHPGHTQIDGFPFSLEIWCKFSTLDTNPQTDALMMSIVDDEGNKAHIGFKNIEAHSGVGGYDNYYFPFVLLEGDSTCSVTADDLTAADGYWTWDSVQYYHTGWSHVVATFGLDNTCILYIDGQENARTTIIHGAGSIGPYSKIQVRINIPTTHEPSHIDYLNNGHLAYAATYNVALDPRRIRRHYWAARRPWDIKFSNEVQVYSHTAQPNGTERFAKGIRATNKNIDEGLSSDRSEAAFRGSGITDPYTTVEDFDGFKMNLQHDMRDQQADPNKDTGLATVSLNWATQNTNGVFDRGILKLHSTPSSTNHFLDPSGFTVGSALNNPWAGMFLMQLKSPTSGSDGFWHLHAKWGRNGETYGDLSDAGTFYELKLTDKFPVSDHNRNGNGWWEGFHHGGGTNNGAWRKGDYTFTGFSCGGGTKLPITHLHQNAFNKSWKIESVDIVAAHPLVDEVNNVQHFSKYFKDGVGHEHPGEPIDYFSGDYPETNEDDFSANHYVVEQFSTHLAIFPQALSRAEIRNLERLSRGKRQMRTRRPTQHLTRFSTITCPARLMH